MMTKIISKIGDVVMHQMKHELENQTRQPVSVVGETIYLICYFCGKKDVGQCNLKSCTITRTRCQTHNQCRLLERIYYRKILF